jgi:hypothetical protein
VVGPQDEPDRRGQGGRWQPAGGKLKKTVDIGPAAFILEPLLAPVRAIAEVLSTADGKDYHVLAQAPVKDPSDPQSAMGSVTHLDEYQTYKKRSRDASISITISQLLLNAVDDNGSLSDAQCPERPCSPIIASVQYQARAYEPDFGQFFGAAGVADLDGSAEGWDLTAGPLDFGITDSEDPVWTPDDFSQQAVGTGPHNVQRILMHLQAPQTIKIPLWPVRKGKLFAVHVSLTAEAADDRGGESAVQAFIEDPQQRDPPLLKTHGLQALGKPRSRSRRSSRRRGRAARAARHRRRG